MAKSASLVYKSEKAFRNMWHEYRVYDNRIELDTLFKTVTINNADIEDISLFSPPVIKTSIFALKIDMADFYTHIGIKRKKGYFKNIRFTPVFPEEFLASVKSVLQQTV